MPFSPARAELVTDYGWKSVDEYLDVLQDCTLDLRAVMEAAIGIVSVVEKEVCA